MPWMSISWKKRKHL